MRRQRSCNCGLVKVFANVCFAEVDDVEDWEECKYEANRDDEN
jgi:hypothetical protein